MIVRRFISLLCAIVFSLAAEHGQASAQDLWSHRSWLGGTGAERTDINPLLPATTQLDSAGQAVTGRLSMRLRRPRGAAAEAAFTAQLVIHDGEKVRTYRGRGAVKPTGELVGASWRSSARDAPAVTVSLQRPATDPSSLSLLGRVVLAPGSGSSRDFPVFVLPRGNPLPADSPTGRFTAFFRDQEQNPGAGLGTGVGAATIKKNGLVRLKATLGDTRRLTARADVVVWADGVRLFLLAQALSPTGFYGAFFVLGPDQSEFDWQGRATCPDSLAPEQKVFMVAYAPPRKSSRPLPWAAGIMEFDLPQADGADSPPAVGLIGWRGSKRLSAVENPVWGQPLRAAAEGLLWSPFQVRLLRMTFKPRDGLVRGRMRYTYLPAQFATGREHLTNLIGAVNQKTSEIEGFIAPRAPDAKSGIVVIYRDTDKPVIVLEGGNPLAIAQGGTFADPGATVDDGVFDAKRTISGEGSIDTAVPGTYELLYTASDTSGNEADSVTRTVIVSPSPSGE